MIGLLFVAACSGDVTESPPPLPVAAERTTFASVAALGSYQLRASVKRTTTGGTGPEQVTTEGYDLKWRDPDHWSYVQTRDGRSRSAVTVWDAVAWAGATVDELRRKGDAEPSRVQVASVWDPWAWGLEGLASGITWRSTGVELVDGRRTEHLVLALAPPPARPPRGWTPTAVEGELWIDEATAVRLKGRVRVDATADGRSQQVELLFSIDGVGLDPGVSPPSQDKP